MEVQHRTKRKHNETKLCLHKNNYNSVSHLTLSNACTQNQLIFSLLTEAWNGTTQCGQLGEANSSSGGSGSVKMGCPGCCCLPVAHPTCLPAAWSSVATAMWKWETPGCCCHSALCSPARSPACQVSLRPPMASCSHSKLAMWSCTVVTWWQWVDRGGLSVASWQWQAGGSELTTSSWLCQVVLDT